MSGIKTKIILLTPDEATRKELERQERIVRALVGSGVFGIKGGSAVLHFDGEGELRRVDRNDTLYRI